MYESLFVYGFLAKYIINFPLAKKMRCTKNNCNDYEANEQGFVFIYSTVTIFLYFLENQDLRHSTAT